MIFLTRGQLVDSVASLWYNKDKKEGEIIRGKHKL